jgi:ribonuclease HIII
MMAFRKILTEPGSEIKLRKMLCDRGFSFENHEHAHFRSQKSGITVILNLNGTLLLQGKEPDIGRFTERFSLERIPQEKKPQSENLIPDDLESAILGLDESGKGDYFGPLVLAGAVVRPENAVKLRSFGVTDSKKLTDTLIKKMIPELVDQVEYQVRVIEPREYNTIYQKFGNLNLLMVSEYKSLMTQFREDSFTGVVLDKFSQSAAQNSEIRKHSFKPITIVEKAESHVSVAAASILARYHFAGWMEKASIRLGFELPKGSGRTAGELFMKIKKNDLSLFENLAKAHFKEPVKK